MNDLKKLVYDNKIFKPGETKILFDKIKDDSKNLYIVSTPLQLLSAIEAQHHFNTQNNILVILFFLLEDGKNINQMFELSKFFPYSKLMTYQSSNGINFKSYIHYLNELSKYQYNHTFFGYGTPIYRRMIANITYKKVYMLDDGIHSITIHKQVYNMKNKINSNFHLTEEAKTIIKTLRNILYFIKGIKVDTKLKDLNFFTIFNLERYNDVIIHDFSYLRSLFILDQKSDNKVYILGQPLQQALQMKSSAYIIYLKNILHKYRNKEKIYIPHRLEIVSKELDYLLSQNKVQILNINSPIEIFFMIHGINPTYIFSFISSALFTLKKMFPLSKPQYIEIDTSPYSEFHQENIQLIYDNYEKDGIQKFKG